MILKDSIKAVIHKQAEYREMEDSPRPDTWSANNRPWPGYLTRGGESDADQKEGHETE